VLLQFKDRRGGVVTLVLNVFAAAIMLVASTIAHAQSSGSPGQSLLDNYDSTAPTYSMSCWTGETGMKKYEIIGENIVVDNINKADIQESRDLVFATVFPSFAGEITLIIDYGKRTVLQKSVFGDESFECTRTK
jgi:hypothetical protein